MKGKERMQCGGIKTRDEERRLIFNGITYDKRQKVGEGQQERTIVNLKRFLKRIKARS